MNKQAATDFGLEICCRLLYTVKIKSLEGDDVFYRITVYEMRAHGAVDRRGRFFLQTVQEHVKGCGSDLL